MSKENKYIRSLVQSAQDGNNAILKQLFEMNLKRIHSLSLRLMGNLQLAKELTVSVFLSSSEQIKSYNPDILFSDWLLLNTIQDAHQKMKKEGKQKKKRKKDGDEEDISALRIEAIDREILNLNDSERIAIVLNKIENIPFEMVAKYTAQSNEKEVQKIIDDAIKNLVKSSGGINSPEDVIDSINNLSREIEFDNETTEEILHKIYEAAEIEEKDKEKEEIKAKKHKPIERVKKPRVKKRKTREVKLPDEKIGKKKILIGAGILAVIVILFVAFTSGSSDWEVIVLSGSVKIDVVVTSSQGTMVDGDAVETNPNSSAEITIPEIGKIEVYPSTIISKMGAKNTAKLKSGSIKIDFKNARSSFKILLPVGIIEDYYLGSSYSVEFNREGYAVISVKDGWLSATYRDVEMILAEEFSVEYKSSLGFGIPYHKSASEELIDMFGQVTFNNNENSVNSILNMATQKDALSLWNLLQRVKTSSKQNIYDKLYELIPHPDEISPSDMLRLDKDKLLLWLENIEWQM